jgi:murein DD-endopeptidase MepM/ murein hydrolase activator NlpD
MQRVYRIPDRSTNRRRHSAGPWVLRTLLVLVAVVSIVVGAAWYTAGRAAGPDIRIISPVRALGRAGELDVLIETLDARLTRLEVVLDQLDRRTVLFASDGKHGDALRPAGPNRLRLLSPIVEREALQLEHGRADLIVTAVRPVLFGLRHATATVRHPLDVRLRPPNVNVLSTHHHVSVGGSEAVVYEVSHAAVASGVRVGEVEYPGFPASGAGIAHAGTGLRVSFFALGWNEDQNVPIRLFARDDVGNEARAEFQVSVRPRRWRKGQIDLSEGFLRKVVPAVIENTPELKINDPADRLGSFLQLNGELRKRNNEAIAALARETAPQILWSGPFRQLGRSAVEGSFADERIYVYGKREVDRQVHLGYDLASTAHAPVAAANRGKVVYASWLGIYGNCVILDHGMGVQSLYAHLSSIAVKQGDMVEQGGLLGQTGSTGLAEGDHLHFTMLVGGTPVNPMEWWSPKWLRDRVTRKLREAEGLGQV